MRTIEGLVRRPLFWVGAVIAVAIVVGVVLAVILGGGGGGTGY